ncbi:fatty acid--CoA ligase [Zavarzinia sp. CC-PAN008]|uniref:fatty acid--CoA ligase n=1 Tax=Zavarzinia sp. CC-PAN008 TaxID=3243332 RepID=UPI003F749891
MDGMAQELSAIRSVADIARHHAQRRPDALAMAFEGRHTTYAALDRRSSQVANGLAALGVGPQDRVAWLDKNSDRFFEAYLGMAKAGAVMVSINWRLAVPEIAFILRDCGAKALVIGHDFAGLVPQLREQAADLAHVLVLGGADDTYEAWVAAQEATDPQRAVEADDVVIQIYTSGTTGHPKGAMLSHRNVMAGLAYVAKGPIGPWGPGDVNLSPLPQFHIGGIGWGLNALFAGATNVILREIDPRRILDTFGEYRVTKAGFVPAVMLMLLNHPDCAKTDFGALDLIGYGASPIPLELLRRSVETFGCGFIQLYGLTETTGPAVALLPQDHDTSGSPRMRSAGKPLPGVRLRILDGAGRDVGVGQVGEIVLRGDVVMTGYWNLPQANASAIRDGWFHTGDAGYVDAEGYVYIHDRVKDMIVTGGENVYPAEVESALFGHPAIADVAVIGVPDERWGEAVKAVVVLKPGAAATAEDLIAHARQNLAGFKCPKTVDFVDVLPRNPSGKLLKRELRAPYWEGRERMVN